MPRWLEQRTRRSEKYAPDRVMPMKEHPRICLIDVDEETRRRLRERGYNCFNGTLGATVAISNTSQGDGKLCQLRNRFPLNLHEYDIVVIDLRESQPVQYTEEDHLPGHIKGRQKSALVSAFPETLFDPRPMSANILASKLSGFLRRQSLLIIWAADDETIDYYPVEITPSGIQHLNAQAYSLYDFYTGCPARRSLTGKDTVVSRSQWPDLDKLLRTHNTATVYDVVFSRPPKRSTSLIKGQNISEFQCLMKSSSGAIVSFAHRRNNNLTFLFPHIKEKAKFLLDLFANVLPGIAPDLFPLNTQLVWLSDPAYQLPNEGQLLNQKARLEEEHAGALRALIGKLERNRQEYSFLHDLLTASNNKLIKSVETFLLWLEFSNVINIAEMSPGLGREDLRIEDDRGVLAIDVKGIAGASTDADCYRIGEIRYRLSKERGQFDVSALYIANHQRYWPPAHRGNQPFTETQIRDAENDERGLVTTYDLFKLYFSISEGYVTKSAARDAFYKIGLVQFPPSGAVRLPDIIELRRGGCSAVLEIRDLCVKVGDTILLDDVGRYKRTNILEIQVNGESVESAFAGEISIKLSIPAQQKTQLWLVQAPRVLANPLK